MNSIFIVMNYFWNLQNNSCSQSIIFPDGMSKMVNKSAVNVSDSLVASLSEDLVRILDDSIEDTLKTT